MQEIVKIKLLSFRKCSCIWEDIVIKRTPLNPQAGNKGQMNRINNYSFKKLFI